MITISYTLIAACCFICLLQPRKERFLVSGIFCLVALIPEFSGLTGISYIAICALSAILGCILIAEILPRTKYAINIMKLLCFEVSLNIFGAIDWFSHLSIKVSNWLFDITNYSLSASLGEMYIYEVIAMAYYAVALITLLDKKGLPRVRDSFAVNRFTAIRRPIFGGKGGS
jgi:hypothetical protein